jgi:hypothetical protein
MHNAEDRKKPVMMNVTSSVSRTLLGLALLAGTLALAGEGTGARITAEIDATLLQFSSVKKVVILNASGNCFADLKDGNDCLK